MKKKEAEIAVQQGTLYWNDPDPIEGNDYRVTNIVYAQPISIIQYNNGESEAEVFNHELINKFKTPQERDNLDLLELVCQLRARAVIHYDSPVVHNAYLEARSELEKRLIAQQNVLDNMLEYLMATEEAQITDSILSVVEKAYKQAIKIVKS